jgi:hypothetical protein
MIANSPEFKVASKLIIALVWLLNGLICKVLEIVPRHQMIVARILDTNNAWLFTKMIGIAEILMVAWIISGVKKRFCAIFQMTIIAVMNILEFLLAPDLLLFGKLNAVFALLFIFFIGLSEFGFSKKELVNVV